jgi:hypothetical protein
MFLCLRRMTLSKQKTLIYFLFFSLLGYFIHTIRGWMSPYCWLFQTTRAHPRVSGVRVAQSLVFCVVYLRSMLVFSLLVIVLSALLRFTASDYHFGVFKLFIYDWNLLTPLNDTSIMFLCLRRMTLSKQKTLIYFLFFSLLGYFIHTIRGWMSPFDGLISVTEKLDHISVSNDSLRGDRGNIILSPR